MYDLNTTISLPCFFNLNVANNGRLSSLGLQLEYLWITAQIHSPGNTFTIWNNLLRIVAAMVGRYKLLIYRTGDLFISIRWLKSLHGLYYPPLGIKKKNPNWKEINPLALTPSYKENQPVWHDIKRIYCLKAHEDPWIVTFMIHGHTLLVGKGASIYSYGEGGWYGAYSSLTIIRKETFTTKSTIRQWIFQSL